MLAESHVYTSDVERKIRTNTPENIGKGYPTNYARFVYCVAYGERSLTGNANHPARDGTPQFWKLLFACANQIAGNSDFAPVMKWGTPDPNERIENKIALLHGLKSAGIWLVDASIVALYRNGQRGIDVRRAVRESWRECTGNVVKEANPSAVICIGSGVWDVLGEELQERFRTKAHFIRQPNARLTAAEHLANFQQYNQICAPFF